MRRSCALWQLLLVCACLLSALPACGATSTKAPRFHYVHTIDGEGREVYTKVWRDGVEPGAQVSHAFGIEEHMVIEERQLAGSGGLVTPQPFDTVCHIALFIEAVAFAQTDITYLRLLEATASGLVVFYAVSHTKGNWYDCHVVWGIIHCCINIGRVFFSYYKLWQINGDLTDEERYLREHHLSTFSPLEFAALKRKWEMVDIPEGGELMVKGEPVESLVLIHSGWANVVGPEGKVVAQVGEGQFLGEMAFFTDEAASATIKADGLMTVVKWDLKEVKHHSHSHHHSETASAFKKLPSLFCRDLAAKMKAANAAKIAMQSKSFFGRKSSFFGRKSIMGARKTRFSVASRFSAVARRMNQRGSQTGKRETLNAGGRASMQGEHRISLQGGQDLGGRNSIQGGGRNSLQGGSSQGGGRNSLQGGRANGNRNSLQGVSRKGSRNSLQGGNSNNNNNLGGRSSMQGNKSTAAAIDNTLNSRSSLQGNKSMSPVSAKRNSGSAVKPAKPVKPVKPVKRELRVSAAKVAPILQSSDTPDSSEVDKVTGFLEPDSPAEPFTMETYAPTKRMETLQPLAKRKPSDGGSVNEAADVAADLVDLTKATQQRQATKAVLRGPSRNMLEHRSKAVHRRTLL